MTVRYQKARLIQQSSSLRWVDLAPLELRLRYRDWHESLSSGATSNQPRWDKDRLHDAVRLPARAHNFLHDLDAFATAPETNQVLEKAVRSQDVNLAWSLLNDGLSRVATISCRAHESRVPPVRGSNLIRREYLDLRAQLMR
eukprot:11669806-Heterocapsa_arctica.AAC.1